MSKAKLTKDELLESIKSYKSKYQKIGFNIVGLFGSYAKDSNNKFSDIDIAYSIDYSTFSKNFKDGFSKVLKIQEIKDELEQTFKRKVDLISINSKNKTLIQNIKKELINV